MLIVQLMRYVMRYVLRYTGSRETIWTLGATVLKKRGVAIDPPFFWLNTLRTALRTTLHWPTRGDWPEEKGGHLRPPFSWLWHLTLDVPRNAERNADRNVDRNVDGNLDRNADTYRVTYEGHYADEWRCNLKKRGIDYHFLDRR